MLKNCFALLGEPLQPWIDPQALQAKFLALSADLHPDRVHSGSITEQEAAHERCSELNAAYAVLREPKLRLGHLLELETGAAPANLERLPSSSADFYLKVGAVCRAADEALKQKPSSPLLKVQFYEKTLGQTEELQRLQSLLEARRVELEKTLKELNGAWALAPPPGTEERKSRLPLEELAQVYRELSYVTRWAEQIRQRAFELML